MDKENNISKQSQIYRVRKDTRLNQALFMCKVILKRHGFVQVEGMGQCISMVTKISQILSKNGFTTMKNLKSETVEGKNSRSINPKLSVKLEPAADFDKLTENISLRS